MGQNMSQELASAFVDNAPDNSVEGLARHSESAKSTDEFLNQRKERTECNSVTVWS
jgi:hypothetical protein